VAECASLFRPTAPSDFVGRKRARASGRAFRHNLRRVSPFFIGLVALCYVSSAVSAAELDWSKAQQLTVVAKNYKFAPKHLKLKSGTPYRIHIENKGSETHEFNAAQLFKDAQLGNPEVLNADRTEIVLQPGQKKDLLLLPTKPGKYPLLCPDHDWAGMTGDIAVE
jgi:uncharacterized cupredoxin-like copper-binding protein